MTDVKVADGVTQDVGGQGGPNGMNKKNADAVSAVGV